MKIAIATVQVPFIKGGAEILVDMLKNELLKRDHQVEIVTIPFKWYPITSMINCMMMGRMMDLSEVNGEKIDLVIATKFPAFYVKHDNKVIWLMHQHRQAYDLWKTPYGDLHLLEEGPRIKELITSHDTEYLGEAKRIYTIAHNTSNRLEKYNGLHSQVLYHPPLNYEKLHCENYGDYIFYPSRIDQVKRQRLLVEAARYVKTDVKFVIAGSGAASELEYIKQKIKQYHLEEKVILTGFISEEEKIRYYSNCLGVYFGAYDEDYGYITLEAFFSKKPVIVHKDAGGPLEFVENEKNGYILDENPELIAKKVDCLFLDRKMARTLGEVGFQSLKEKNMNWDYVIENLLK